MATPDGFVDILLARYSVNKDVVTRFREAIGNMTAAQVKDFLKALSEGGRIEYISHE